MGKALQLELALRCQPVNDGDTKLVCNIRSTTVEKLIAEGRHQDLPEQAEAILITDERLVGIDVEELELPGAVWFWQMANGKRGIQYGFNDGRWCLETDEGLFVGFQTNIIDGWIFWRTELDERGRRYAPCADPVSGVVADINLTEIDELDLYHRH